MYNVYCSQPREWQCKVDTTCNNATGYCDEGCEDELYHCKGGETCNHVTSLCDVGYADGWYGVKCTQQCEGHCRDN